MKPAVPALLATLILGGQAQGDWEMDVKKLLARGININHIFEPYRAPSKGWTPDDDTRIENKIHEREFELVADLGFTHVRLPLGRAFLQEYEPPCALREEGFKILDRVLDICAKNNLAVVIDMHQVPVPPLDSDPAQRKGFVKLWRAIADRYSKRKQDLFYELLNEPRVEDAAAWREIVLELVTEIREGDPNRAIIVTGGGWGGIDNLLQLGISGIPHLIYSFHFYDPFVLTHQGATWSGREMPHIKGIRYPLDPAQMKAEKTNLEKLGLNTWPVNRWLSGGGKEEIRKLLAPAFQLARESGVILYCGEFGVHKPYAPPADRARWITDVRTLLEEAGICWSMWAYHAGFDLVEKDGAPTPAVVEALGLSSRK